MGCKLEEIQEAHDILHAVISGEVDLDADQGTVDAWHAAHDALCFVLNHPAGEEFKKNIRRIKAEAASHGFVLKKAPHPFVGQPPETIH